MVSASNMLAVTILVAAVATITHAAPPNIVFVLTDDQDQMLGGSWPKLDGVTPMKATDAELSQKGATANNWRIHTPICCPSRAELVTGRYFHNIKEDVTEGKCLSGYGKMPCCMHVDEDLVNNQTLALYLKNAGYTVGMFGKYLNVCPDSDHVPPGFDVWFANGGGTYYSPSFAAKNVEFAGIKDGMWHGTKEDYSTAVIGNVSMAWLKEVSAKEQPFVAYIGPKACHEPFLPAPWYADAWDPSWPDHEPRPVSWNCSFESRADHHYTIKTEPLISPQGADFITTSYKNRWRTLMSVDDLIKEAIQIVDDAGKLDNTYFIFTSDHGFQLGEFNIPIDKRNLYEYNLKIHFLIRGPGIKPGSTFDYFGSNVDVAPTILGLAGIEKPAGMDGKSIVPLITDPKDPAVAYETRAHIAAHANAAATWRDSSFVEYYFVDNNTKCIPECHNVEDPSNNFIGIRHLAGSEFGETVYAEYQYSKTSNVTFDAPTFYEYYDLENDEWQMNNLYNTADKDKISKLHDKLHMWFNCKGESCP